MRWENLTVEQESGSQLPGFREPARVRTFDAPDALGTRFYEVRARSALNRVRGSRLPFNWSINPYRGCSHACVYCMAGETPVLMRDGGTKPLADLRAGDEIYGTVRRGHYRRYVGTQVLAHWETRAAAYRVTLENETELVAGANHRFLTDRGWKYVTGAEQGDLRRPHLTLNNKLVGMGALTVAPAESRSYRDGYLCGVIRGDGHIGPYSYEREGRTKHHHRFRLALADREALERAQRYLSAAGVSTSRFLFYGGSKTSRPVEAIRSTPR